jgi:hypothetical protein
MQTQILVIFFLGILEIVSSQDCTPPVNGCGSGITLPPGLDRYGYTGCCNGHDICYGTCGRDKNSCDTDFLNCNMGVCHGDSACVAGAQAMYHAVQSGGQSAYNGAQATGCGCMAKKSGNKQQAGKPK